MFKEYNIKEIRVLPMDNKKEFPEEQQVRDFLESDLAKQDGKYYYRNRGINLKNTDALILFQYKGNIVGYGIFQTRVKEPYNDVYKGYNQFYENSVYNIEKITAEEFHKIDKNFKKFCQSMLKVDIQLLQPIISLVNRKRKLYEETTDSN